MAERNPAGETYGELFSICKYTHVPVFISVALITDPGYRKYPISVTFINIGIGSVYMSNCPISINFINIGIRSVHMSNC